ncbi:MULTISPECIES: cellulose synthase [unclassified Rhizobium]|uniref:cellulose synthase n=1 Tax=unclassified Rhizobium TaxID=2613769 RepID=UPI000CDF55DD|nr:MULTISPECIES: cellulose synthase [Rhizobium]AVA22854.1 tetratricopeptide repeat-containing protein [Rhizobium sp. NXC24]UWU20234.1 cellulose synthase [Rhizobium tropici]
MKSSLLTVSAAVVVAGLVIATKGRGNLEEGLGLAAQNRQDSQVSQTGSIKPVDMAFNSPPLDMKTVSDRIQATAPSAVLSDTSPPVQAASDTPDAVAQATPQSATPPPKVDESALRYFASHGDKARLQAEISRLQALYPDWVPPADPLAIPQNSDKQLEAMWQLYSEGRYAELRKAIADRQAAETGWQPPADLLERLDVAEARARLVNASDLKQYATVVDIGANTPSLLTCSDIDILWRVAEAFIKTNRSTRGQDAYVYILKNCVNPQERLATVQKASALQPYQPMQDLLALEKPDGNGGREFDSIRTDLARRFVAEGNDDPKLSVAPDYISQVERAAETQGLASDALLLGWYHLRHQNNGEAEKWFRMARAKDDSASASQGLALILIDDHKPQEAEDVMYRWRNESKDATATYLAATANLMALQPPANLSEDVLSRMAAEVIEQKYVPTAQEFGWYARSLNQPQTAIRWFETALRWKPDDEPSAYGLAITRNQLNDRQGVAEIQRLWAGRSERIARLGEVTPQAPIGYAPLPSPNQTTPQMGAAPTNAQPLATPAPSETNVNTRQRTTARVVYSGPETQVTTVRRGARGLRGCSATINAQRLDPADALNRGWCLMDLNRPMEAIEAFEVALNSPAGKAREDAAYGQSLAYLRVGLANNAAVAAAKAPLSRQRAAELQVAILADRALTAFSGKRYQETLIYLDQRAQLQQERVDLMVLRGYCYLNLKMYDDAERIFTAVAATGNKDGNRGLNDLRLATHAKPGD